MSHTLDELNNQLEEANQMLEIAQDPSERQYWKEQVAAVLDALGSIEER